MRKLKIVLLVLLALVVGVFGYGAYLYVLAGELKSIEPHFDGVCHPVEGVVGAEDITIHPNGRLAFISSDDRRATLAGEPRPGAIYAYDLTTEGATPVNLTPNADNTFHPHGIGLFVSDDGRARLFVVNHPGASLFGDNPGEGPPHTIEIFDWVDGQLNPVRTLSDPLLVSPNDVAPVGLEHFYVTNDHGFEWGFLRTLEDYLRLARATVVYFDGESFEAVAEDLRYPNGVQTSADGSQIYVASTTGREMIIFDRDAETGALTRAGDVALGTGPDNIERDAEGNLWVGAHPKLLTFVSYSKDSSKLSPSQVLELTPDGEGGFEVEEVFLSDGSDLSGSSVAARRGRRLLIGSVFDPRFLDCEMAP